MQFSAIRTYCALRFRDTGNVVVSDTEWKSYVNSAYGDILTRMPYAPWNEFSATVSVTAGSRSGTLPTNAFRVIAVWNATDAYPMVPLEGREEVYNQYPEQTETGQPQQYRLFNNTVQVYPIPTVNTSLTVEYLKQAGDLSADADLPVIPEAYHDLLVAGAVMMAYKDDGNLQMAAAYAKEYEDGIKELEQEAGQPRSPRYNQIVDYGV